MTISTYSCPSVHANAISSETERLTDDEVIGQVGYVLWNERYFYIADIRHYISNIIFAGFDTTSTALSRLFHILASEPEMQARLRTEIRQAQRDYGSTHLPYDILMSLPYLDAILRESLRMHPPTSMLSRM